MQTLRQLRPPVVDKAAILVDGIPREQYPSLASTLLITKRQQLLLDLCQRLALGILLLEPTPRCRVLIPKAGVAIEEALKLSRIMAHHPFVRCNLGKSPVRHDRRHF